MSVNLPRFDQEFLFPDPADDAAWRARDVLHQDQFSQEVFEASERGPQLVNVLPRPVELFVEGVQGLRHRRDPDEWDEMNHTRVLTQIQPLKS